MDIEIDCKPGLNKSGRAITRQAVRGIILDGHSLLMIHSRTKGDYKFPGGGINSEENPTQALAREIEEECGATLARVIALFGQAVENDQPVEPDYDLFRMTSTYYLCEIQPEFGQQRLEDYEADLGFHPVWIEIDEAIRTNRSLLGKAGMERWVQRETLVLEHLKKRLEDSPEAFRRDIPA